MPKDKKKNKKKNTPKPDPYELLLNSIVSLDLNIAKLATIRDDLINLSKEPDVEEQEETPEGASTDSNS